MPHKKNPVTAEQICGLARVVRANASAAMENMPLWHERDISHSSVERIIMPDSTILMDYMLAKSADMVRNLVVFPEKMEANLRLTGGGIFSESVLLGLIRSGLSREEAYVIVQSVSHASMESGMDFQEALLSDGRVTERLSREEIDDCFSPEKVLERVDEIFRRVYQDEPPE
jgi:adenylosuccinate lyase